MHRSSLINGKKNLNLITKNSDKIILIDDNDIFFQNDQNTIKIKPFYGNLKDYVLLKLKEILLKIHKFDDIRKGILNFKK